MIAGTPTSVNDQDVLFGRGKLQTYHAGNISFRAMIESRFDEYHAGDNRGYVRQRLFGEVTDAVDEAGGRFLKKVGGLWVEVDKETARCKVAQHFRDGAKLRRMARSPMGGCEFALEFVKDSTTRTFGEMVEVVSERLPLERNYFDYQHMTDARGKRTMNLGMASLKASVPMATQSLGPAMVMSRSVLDNRMPSARFGLEPLPVSAIIDAADDETSAFNLLAQTRDALSKAIEGCNMTLYSMDKSSNIDTLESWSEITDLLDSP